LIEIISIIVVVISLATLAWIDLKTFQLPDGLTISLAVYGLIANGLLGLGWTDTLSALIGCVSGYLSLYLLNLAYFKIRKTNGIGMGDAKLLAGLGACFGWQSLPYILMIASTTGLLGGYIWLKVHQQNSSHAFPFGPFIALGGIITLIWLIFNIPLNHPSTY
jgi:prepilin signal peptidase PulO-like enzyme (type II secretory pathway)